MKATNALLARFGIEDASELPDQRGVRSVPFEPHLVLAECSEHEGIDHVTDRLLKTWLASYQRVPSAKKQEQFAACARLIVLNLLRAEARSQGLAVGMSSSTWPECCQRPAHFR